jgi:predicted ATPase
MLLERDRELATLAEQLRLARLGSGSLVLIGGEEGAGKTRLVTEFVQPLGRQAVIGACARCRRRDPAVRMCPDGVGVFGVDLP